MKKKVKKIKKKSAKVKDDLEEEEFLEEEPEEEIDDDEEEEPTHKKKKKLKKKVKVKAKTKTEKKAKAESTGDADEQKLVAIKDYLKKGKEFPYRPKSSAGLAFEIIENKGDGKSIAKLVDFFESQMKKKKIACSNPKGRFQRVLRDCVLVKMVEVKKGRIHHL